MKNFKKIMIIVMLLMVSVARGTVLANPNGNPSKSDTETVARPIFIPPLGDGAAGGSDLKTIFLNVLDVVQTIMIMLTTLYLIFAGFMFVTAKGDPGKLKKARDALLWGLVGAALILCAEVLAYGIGDTVKEVFKGK
ncbi:hypothetical protein H7Y21_01115 [Arenimonas sp.]|nr:hypothetical protein [Candidatus Parcubacteria bacterium]